MPVPIGWFTYRYFMPVSLPVDSLSEMWCRWVKEPRLRAMSATVRKRARAALAPVLGLVAFCLPCPSPLRGALRPWSVQAKDTCMPARVDFSVRYRPRETERGQESEERLLTAGMLLLSRLLLLFCSHWI